MSVRNFQTKNYTKVAPFPPSSTGIPSTQVTPKHYENFLATTGRLPVTPATSYNKPGTKYRQLHGENLRNATTRTLVSRSKTNVVVSTSTAKTQYGQRVGKSTNANAYLNNNRVKATENRKVNKTNTDSNSNIQRLDRTNLLQDVVRKDGNRLSTQHFKAQQTPLKHTSKPVTPKSVSRPKPPKVKVGKSISNGGDMSGSRTSIDRPKSARPDSRMMRHRGRSEVNDNKSEDTRTNRPKSARPESRMMNLNNQRMENLDNQHQVTMYVSDSDIPPRPTTSHGRRRKSSSGANNADYTVEQANQNSQYQHQVPMYVSDSDLPTRPTTSHGRRRKSSSGANNADYTVEQANQNSQYTVTGRPKSRLGNRPRDDSLSSDDSGVTYLYTSGPTYSHVNRNRYVSDDDEAYDSELWTETYNYAIRNNQNSDNAVSVNKSRSLTDLRKRIDDIDLDVDPVEFFYQDDAFTPALMPNVTLQSGVIDSSTNSVSSFHSKAAIGYQGNYVNTHEAIIDNTNRYHSNQDFSRQMLEHESNQNALRQMKRSRIRSDSLITTKQMDSPAFEDTYHSRESLAETAKTYKSPMSDKSLSKYRNMNSVASMKLGQIHNSTTFVQTEHVLARRPRKLAPITVSTLNKKQY